MTQEHNNEMKRRLTECNGVSLNHGSTRYLTGYTHSGNMANSLNIEMFKDEKVSDVIITDIGREHYYKYIQENNCLAKKTFLDSNDIDNIISRKLDYGLLTLKDYKIDSLSFYRSTILKDVSIKNGSYKNIKLEGANLLGFTIFNVECLNSLVINSCEFANDIVIESNNTDIIISNVSGTKLKIFIKGKHSKIKIGKDVRFSEGITISGTNEAFSPTIESLSFESADITADVKLENLLISKLSILKTDFKKQVIFFQIVINHLSLLNSSFISSEKGRLVSCKVVDSLAFHAVDFGNMTFTNCNAEGLDSLLFSGVNLSDCTSVGTSWESKLNVIPVNQRYDYFKQILKMHDAEKDVQKYIKFKALYLEEIRNNINIKSEKFSLGLSYYSSEHGTNWLRPTYILLLFTLINFFFINGCNYLFSTNHNLITFLPKDALVLMNPAHLFSHYSFDNAWGVFYFWATCMRVVNGYLLFQVIKSFRKYI